MRPAFDNQGTVRAAAGTLTFLGPVSQLSGGTLTGGTWHVVGSPTTTLNLNSPGAINITTNQGTVILEGADARFPRIDTLQTNQGAFKVLAGRRFQTAGSLTSPGTIALGASGMVAVSGSYSQTGTLQIELGGGGGTPGVDYGQLTATGPATFGAGARIVVSLVGGFVPADGQVFDVVVADTIDVSAFPSLADLVTLPTLPAGRAFAVARVDTASQAIRLTVTSTPTLPVPRMVSVGVGGAPPDGASLNPALSADGRFVVFESTARNLVVSGCTTGGSQIFLHDRVTQATTCVSVGPRGAPGDGPSTRPAISADGRVVAFVSSARNLVAAGCTAGIAYVFVRELATGTTTCVAVATSGAVADGPSDAPALSADGRLVAFVSAATTLDGCPGGGHVFVRDRGLGTTTCASVGPGDVPGNAPSREPALSPDGGVLAFESAATNLVAQGCTTPVVQIFVRVLLIGETTCASTAPDGSPGDGPSHAPALSQDGAVLAFVSAAGNLAAPCAGGGPQVFLVNRLVPLTRCLSVSPGGQPGNGPSADPALSADGLTVVFITQATNLTAAALGGDPAAGRQLPPGPTSTVRWQDFGPAVQGAVTLLVTGTAGGSGQKPTAVSANGLVTVTETQTPGAGPVIAAIEDVPAPPAGQPLIIAPAPNTSFSVIGAIPLTFQWTAVANAAGYRLAFSGPASLSLDVVPTTFTAVLTPDIPVGAYQLQVIPLGADATPGTPSAPLAFTLLAGVAVQAGDRPYLTTPQDEVPVTRGQTLTFAWTAVAGVTQYGFEFTGTDLVFANPNGTAPDGVNGFGGAGGGFLVVGTSVTVTIPETAPGRYQVRVVALTPAVVPLGSFSDAVTVVVQ